jgi:hypothetical protein
LGGEEIDTGLVKPPSLLFVEEYFHDDLLTVQEECQNQDQDVLDVA